MTNNSPSKRPLIFTIIGIVNTAIDFSIYSILVHLIFRNTDHLAIAIALSTLCTTIFAYILHKSFTWRDRKTNRLTVVKFFTANAFLVIVRPLMTMVFGLLAPLYSFAFDVSSWLGFPFCEDVITSTGVFGLVTVFTLIINYFIYNRLVFTEKIPKKQPKKS